MNKSFKDLMQPGKKNIGTILQVPSEELAEMLGHAGLELIILDMEHCVNSLIVACTQSRSKISAPMFPM